MIKKNNFYTRWLLIIGMITNVMYVFGAENFDVFSFLSSKESPSKQEIMSFTTYLYNANEDCKKSTLQEPENCEWLVEILKQKAFVNKCKSILGRPDIEKSSKENLAKTYFEIKFNERIKDQRIDLPMEPLIRSNLSPAYLLTLEIQERQPDLWNTASAYQLADISISAIHELGKIITDHKMGKMEASSGPLTKNILGYLTHINNFFKNGTNLASKSLIGSDIEQNKNFLTTLVKITANDEIKKAYNTLTRHVSSLPSFEELFTKPIPLPASPTQSILTPNEMTILNEAIKNPNNPNEYLILTTIEKIIRIVESPRPDSLELKNELDTIASKSYWKDVEFNEKVIEIITRFLNHQTFKDVCNNITEQDYKIIINESIEKIKESLTLSIAPQLPTIAAMTVVKGLHQPTVQQSPKPVSYQQSSVPPVVFTPQQQHFVLPTHQQPVHLATPGSLQQPFIQHQMLFSDTETEKLSNIRTSNPLDTTTVNAIDAIFNINKFFYSGKQQVHFNSLWIPSIIALAQYNGKQLKPYIEKIIRNPDFEIIKHSIMSQPASANKEDFINACITLEKSLSTYLPTRLIPTQPKKLSSPIVTHRIQDFTAKRTELRDNLNDLNSLIANAPDKTTASKDQSIQNTIDRISQNTDPMTPLDLLKFTRLLKHLNKNEFIPNVKLQPPYEGLFSNEEATILNKAKNGSAMTNIKNINDFFINGCPDSDLRRFTSNVIQLANSNEITSHNKILESYIKKMATNIFFMNICTFIINGFNYTNKQDFIDACKKLNPNLIPKRVILQQPLVPITPPKGLAASVKPQAPTIQPVVAQQKQNVAINPNFVVQAPQNPNQPQQQPTIPDKNPTNGSESGWLDWIPSTREIVAGIGSLFSGIANWIRSFFP